MDNQKVELQAGISVDQLIKQLTELKNQALQSQKELAEMMTKVGGSSNEASKQIGTLIGRIEAQKAALEKANAELAKIRATSTAAFDDKQAKIYEDRIKKIQAELDGIKNNGIPAIDGVNKKAKEGTGALGGMADAGKLLIGNLLKMSLVTAVIGGVIQAGKQLIDSIFGASKARKIQIEIEKDFQKISVDSQQAAQKERIELDALLVIARDLNRSTEERQAAVDRINARMPPYLEKIKLETINTAATTKAIDAYIKNIDAKARAQAYISVLQDKFNKLIELESLLTNAAAMSHSVAKTTYINGITDRIDMLNQEIGVLKNKFQLELQNGTADLDLKKEQRKIYKEDAKERGKDAIDEAKRSQDITKDAIEREKKRQAEQRKTDADRRRSAAADRADDRAKDRAQREEEARLKRILDLEKQLATLRAQLADEGKKKDIAEENAKFNNAIDSLSLLRDKANISAEEIALIDQLVETQKQLHYKNLAAINEKYYVDAVQAFKEAQEQIDEALLTDEDKEIADLERKYQKIIDSISDAKLKAIEAIGDDSSAGLDKKGGFTIKGILSAAFDQNASEQINELTNNKNKEVLAIQQKWDLKKIEESEKLAIALNDILQVQGLNEEELTRLKEFNKLKIIIDFAKQRLEILKKDKDANQLAIAELVKTIEDASKKLNEGTKGTTDIFDYLGIDPDDEEKIKAIGDAVSVFGEQFSSFLSTFEEGINRQIRAKEKLISSIEDSIQKQQEAVDREKELQEKGFANNLGIEQARLAALEAQKEKELELERKLKKEKAALQKAQIIADGLAQTSNLITASTSIFAAMAPLGPIGVGFAIAAIGLMLTSFIAAKAQAIKAANAEARGFRKGGYYDILKEQPSHEQGGVGLYREKDGKKLAEFEGDEKLFIVNKGSAKKYDEVLDAINKDQLSSWSIDRLRGLVKPTNVTFNREEKPATITIKEMPVMTSVPQTQEDYLKRIADSNEQLLQIEKEKETITDYPDRTEYRKGNNIRIVNKNVK